MFKGVIDYLTETNKKVFVVENVRIFRCVDPQKNNKDQFYLSEKVIGEGAFAKVYLGYPLEAETGIVDRSKPVAIKVFKKGGLEKITKEAAITGKYYKTAGPFKLENSYLIITEYHSGHELCDYFDKEDLKDDFEKLNLEERLEALWQLALQLILMHHGEPIVHGDIKFENTLLELRNAHTSSPRIKNTNLVDFGCALPISSDADEILKINTIQGTLSCMAPEVFCGEYPLNSDIYSFVPIALAILNALKPFYNKRNNAQFFEELFNNSSNELKELANDKDLFKYNFSGLLVNIILPNPNLKIYIQKFLERMQCFNYIERPNSDETLRFFTLLRNYVKQHKENSSSPELVIYEAKLLILANGWWGTEIGECEVEHYSYQDEPENIYSVKFTPLRFKSNKEEEDLQINGRTCKKATQNQVKAQTFEQYDLEENEAKLILELIRQSKLDAAFLQKLIINKNFAEILSKLFEHNLLTEQMIDILDNDPALCAKVCMIQSAEVIYLVVCGKDNAWESFSPEQALRLYKNMDDSQEILENIFNVEVFNQIKSELLNSILTKMAFSEFFNGNDEGRQKYTESLSRKDKLFLYQIAVEYGIALKEKLNGEEYQKIRQELIDNIINDTEFQKFFNHDQNAWQEYLKQLDKGKKFVIYQDLIKYESVLREKFENKKYHLIRTELRENMVADMEFLSFYNLHQNAKNEYLKKLSQASKMKLQKEMSKFKQILKEKFEDDSYSLIRAAVRESIGNGMKFSSFYNLHQNAKNESLKKLSQAKKIELHKEMIDFRKFLKERFGDDKYQEIKDELIDNILGPVCSHFFSFKENKREECLGKLSKEKKFFLHGAIVRFKQILEENWGVEKYQQIREQLSDSILTELSIYNESKTKLAKKNPQDYEGAILGGLFFGKYRTNAAKAKANNKAKEVFKSYLKGEGPNPNEFFKQEENKELLKSLQQGRSKDISESLFAYAARLVAPAA